ncbi:beta-lactamase-like protein [Microdochium bolleyi]|uniref:Beta-lactamase-like protein n=1 Tax=Microdochium bolleyi TaxID=196109 RepID=A0A136J8T9_9PEZI|nr:beta-lactamase-like protein [Microdochium bolleyi]
MPAPIHITVDPHNRTPLLRDQKSTADAPDSVPVKQVAIPPTLRSSTASATTSSAATGSQTGPADPPTDLDGSVYFIGTATTILEWRGLRILTDPNFLHAGDHVHLGPGVSATRRTNPAVDLHELPPLDLVLLSHYHEDHFDRLVEGSLRRDVRIVTTPHAKKCLEGEEGKEEGMGGFTDVTGLDFWESAVLHVDEGGGGRNSRTPAVKITGMPGKHIPPGPLSIANDLLKAVPPTNGWLLELGYEDSSSSFSSSANTDTDDGIETGYRIYISGDTLMVDELKDIPKHLQDNRIDLMLVHLGGTTIPGPSMPLLMVTMDAEQGFRLMQLMDPDVTIPVHFDDYDVFLSPLKDFRDKVEKEGWGERVVFLDRGEMYRFKVGQ